MSRMGENGGSLEPRMMEPELRNNGSSQSEEQPASGQKSVKCSVRKKKSLRARYAYGVIFLLTNIIAWLFRDYGERILPVLPCKFGFFSFHCRGQNLQYNVAFNLRCCFLFKSLRGRGARMLPYDGSSSCQFRMLCILTCINFTTEVVQN
ncbi:UNVERIFIED_CONTAM: hypothetical protein Sradi_1616500 [Sesamum radiatum]|uniref:Rhomboid-like protein n=1 Tax=Sesamum radiatum TaxID=300843 RepID=A0AAW2UAG0_SESRA